MLDVYKLLINGRWVESESGERFLVTNPANGKTVAEVARGGVADVQAALQAAHGAFSQWAGLPARERAELMHRAAAIFCERLDGIATLLTREQGKPLNDSLKELRFSADVIDYCAEEGRRLTGTHFEGDGGATHWRTFMRIAEQMLCRWGSLCERRQAMSNYLEEGWYRENRAQTDDARRPIELPHWQAVATRWVFRVSALSAREDSRGCVAGMAWASGAAA